jgi:COP9 signalosome complex subunit 6
MADSGMDIRVHPLVVLHIADHFTRVFQQSGNQRVLGALMGSQVGRVVNIVDAFDIAYDFNEKDQKASGNDLATNPKFVEALKTFEDDKTLFKATFPQYEVLGWYTTAGSIEAIHGLIHKQMKQFNERPLFFLVDQKIDPKTRDLPCTLFSEVIHVSGDKITAEFVPSVFKIESEEAERVTAVHCAKVISQTGDGNTSTVTPHYAQLQQAVTTLNQRLKVVQSFLRDTQSKKIKEDHAILRQIKGMVNRLPAANAVDFKENFVSEYNDALLVTYLATITKSANIVNEVVDKFNVAFAQRRRGPMFF